MPPPAGHSKVPLRSGQSATAARGIAVSTAANTEASLARPMPRNDIPVTPLTAPPPQRPPMGWRPTALARYSQQRFVPQ